MKYVENAMCSLLNQEELQEGSLKGSYSFFDVKFFQFVHMEIKNPFVISLKFLIFKQKLSPLLSFWKTEKIPLGASSVQL